MVWQLPKLLVIKSISLVASSFHFLGPLLKGRGRSGFIILQIMAVVPREVPFWSAVMFGCLIGVDQRTPKPKVPQQTTASDLWASEASMLPHILFSPFCSSANKEQHNRTSHEMCNTFFCKCVSFQSWACLSRGKVLFQAAQIVNRKRYQIQPWVTFQEPFARACTENIDLLIVLLRSLVTPGSCLSLLLPKKNLN